MIMICSSGEESKSLCLLFDIGNKYNSTFLNSSLNYQCFLRIAARICIVCDRFLPVSFEAGSLFELFYRKTSPLHSLPIEITGFSKSLTEDVLLKNGKSSHEKIYSGSHFRHGISHKSCVSSFPYNASNLAGALYAKV